jgi:hypothetical protein
MYYSRVVIGRRSAKHSLLLERAVESFDHPNQPYMQSGTPDLAFHTDLMQRVTLDPIAAVAGLYPDPLAGCQTRGGTSQA